MSRRPSSAAMEALGLHDRIRVTSRELALTLTTAAELEMLLDQGLLEEWEALVKTMTTLPIDRPPLAVWRAGAFDPTPDAAHISWLAEKRFKHLPLVKTKILRATKRAIRIFGGHGGETPDDKLSHELAVAQLYVKARREMPELAPYWISEEARSRKLELFEKCPDVVFGIGDEHWLAWEFIGVYPAKKIQAFIDDLQGRPLSYVLW